MMFLCKTSPPHQQFGQHFEGKAKSFEMQIQARFKKVPSGIIYMGAELQSRPKWGLITQTLSTVIMKFASTLVKTMHYSFGKQLIPKISANEGEVELMHATFPLWRVMDRVSE
ncbi:unnamed protein product [Chrysoparadoxa australica]